MDSSGFSEDKLGVLLGNLALQRGYLTAARLREALAEQARQAASGGEPQFLGELLVARKFITPIQLDELLADQETQTGIRRPAGSEAPRPRSPARPATPGAASFGKYQLLRKLGRGAVGAVFEAVDTSLDRKVALKLLLSSLEPGAGVNDREQKRFIKEARLAANVPRHPHVVTVYEAGELDGKLFIAMELVEGRQMDAWRKTGPPLRQQVRVLRDAALAVHHAHEEGVIHRDLKPQNILIDAKSEPHVADFGLALEQRLEDRSSVSAVGAVQGTPAYMSPEQAQGSLELDRRTDVYALGVMLYEILTGRVPFRGSTPLETIMMVGHDPVPPPSNPAGGPVDPVLEATCLKALSKEPRRRHATAKHLADELSRWHRGASFKGPSLKASRLNLFLAVGAAAVLLLAIVLAVRRPGGADPDAAQMGQAAALAREGKHAAAADLYDLVLIRNPGHPGARAGKAEALRARKEVVERGLRRASEYARQGRHRDALGAWLEVLDTDPSNPAARAGLRDAQSRLNDEKAEAERAARGAASEAERRAAAERVKDIEKATARIAPPEVPRAGPAGNRDAVQFAMGNPEASVGLNLLDIADGRWQAVLHEGTPCVRALVGVQNNHRLYFDVDDAWARTVSAAELEVEYWDAPKDYVHVQYDSSDAASEYGGAFRKIPEIQRSGSGGWKTWRMTLDLPMFRNRQWNAADFRVQGHDLLVRRVALKRVSLPAVHLAAAGSAPRFPKPGLLGATYSGRSFGALVATRADPEVRFQWADKAGPDGMTGNFSIRWTGWFRAPAAGRYRFETASDDGVRLSVGDRVLVDAWTDHPLRTDTALCELEEGFHAVRLEYYQGTGPGLISLAAYREVDGKRTPLAPLPVFHEGEPPTAEPSAPNLWELLVENRQKVTGQPVALARRDLPGAKYAVKDVTPDALLLSAVLEGGGNAEIAEPRDGVRTALVVDLLEKAGALLPAAKRVLAAVALAEAGDFDRAFRELEKAKPPAVEAGAYAAGLEWASIEKATPDKDRKRAHEKFLKTRAAWVSDELRKAPDPSKAAAAPAPAAAWTPLFDGAGLAGWQTVGGQPRVEDRALVLEGGAEVMTRIDAADFELAGAFLMSADVGLLSGGIAFRRPGRAAEDPRIGLFIDGDIHVREPGKDSHRVGARTLRPREWQAFLLRLQGAAVTLEVEGKTVYVGETVRREAGHVALYAPGAGGAPGAKIAFRDLRWRKLPSVAPDADTGPLGWWRLDDGRGTVASDASGRGHAGVLHGGTTWIPGKSGGALQLDGTSGYVEIANSRMLENVQEGDYTLAAWYHPLRVPPGKNSTDNDNSHGILVKQGYHLGLMYGNDGHFRFEHWLGNDQLFVGAPKTSAPGAWHHVAGAVSRKAGTAAVYVNGTLENRRTFTAGTACKEFGNVPWRIGTGHPTQAQWRYFAEGAVDDVRIYGRALEEAEVRALAASPAGRR